ncbi:MAG: DNA polymerase III subunit delta' [Elusimicrobia bacterium CG1_02_63_36]|nr:MAG: DNA polymerase III subunit delta' [Elusimicrobia bacterium CG1_02_63_36]
MKLSELVGQDRAGRRLKDLVVSERVPPALLFQGPRGVGKAGAALALYAALNCSKRKTDSCGECPSCASVANGADSDLHRVDSAYQAGLRDEETAKQRSIRIDTVRHAIEIAGLRSFLGRWKAVIIEDAHLLEKAAANAMLKALEEPPPKTVWILTTHRPGDLLGTIRSRCQTLNFGPLGIDALIAILGTRGIDEAAARAAAPLAEGSARRALELIETPPASPSDWISDPMGPFTLADALPKELHLARPVAEKHLHRIAWFIREKRGTQGYRFAPVRSVLREIDELHGALKSNADPKIIVELAAFRLQQLHSIGGFPS